MTDIEQIKMLIREKQYPAFEDDEIAFYLSKNNNNIYQTARELLLIKAEDCTLSVSGISMNDMSKYFMRLAENFKTSSFIEFD